MALYLIETKELDETIGRWVGDLAPATDPDAPVTHQYTSDRAASGPNIITCEALTPSDWRYELFAHQQ